MAAAHVTHDTPATKRRGKNLSRGKKRDHHWGRK